MKKIAMLILAIVCSITCMSTLAACNNGKVDTLIVYTNQTSGGRGSRLQTLVQSAGFDFEVVFVELAGQNLKNRLISEKNAPISDVVLGGGIVEHMDLKKQNVTAPFFPSWLDKVDDVHKDTDGYYSPWSIEPLYLVYNQSHYTNDPTEVNAKLKLAPTGYEDLANNFAGQYNVFKTTSATGSTIYASILSQYRDPNGQYNVSEEGWNLLRKLFAGGEIDAGLWQQNLAGNKKPISMTWAGAIVDIEEVFGIELGIVRPEGGVPVNITQVAITDSKKSARMDAAKQFVEWWGLTETQVAWSVISGQAPANADAFELVSDDVKNINTADAMELDWQFIADNLSSWNQYIELSILG